MEFDLNIENTRLRVFRDDKFTDRPTIIFLHDSLGCIKLWQDFPKKLGDSSGYNIMIYDRQGYGLSAPFSSTKRKNDYLETEADRLIKLLVKCEIDEAILYGHSDGGTIALIAAAKYPDKISAVITEGAHIFVEENTLAGLRKVAERYKTTDLKEKLKKYHGAKTNDLFLAWINIWLSEEFKTWNIEDKLSEIKCPVLVIQGENDEFGSDLQTETIIDKVKGLTEKIIIPDSGHSPHKEAKELTLNCTLHFLEKIKLLKKIN